MFASCEHVSSRREPLKPIRSGKNAARRPRSNWHRIELRLSASSRPSWDMGMTIKQNIFVTGWSFSGSAKYLSPLQSQTSVLKKTFPKINEGNTYFSWFPSQHFMWWYSKWLCFYHAGTILLVFCDQSLISELHNLVFLNLITSSSSACIHFHIFEMC